MATIVCGDCIQSEKDESKFVHFTRVDKHSDLFLNSFRGIRYLCCANHDAFAFIKSFENESKNRDLILAVVDFVVVFFSSSQSHSAALSQQIGHIRKLSRKRKQKRNTFKSGS